MESEGSQRYETVPSGNNDELIASKLTNRITSHGVAGYLERLRSSQKDTQSFVAIHELANFIIPIDPDLGPDLSHPGHMQFIIGGLIGIDIARKQLGIDSAPKQLGKYTDQELARKVIKLFQQLSNETDGRDELDRYHAITEALLSAGQQQWLDSGAYYELTEKIEAEACPEIAYQSYLEAGMGMMLLAGATIKREREAERHKKDLQQFADSLQGIHDFDWDSAFRGEE